MGQKNERMDGESPSPEFQGQPNSRGPDKAQKGNGAVPKFNKKNAQPDFTDEINLTNSMIVSESTDPNKDYKKLNCLGDSQGTAVYRVQHNITEDIRAMKVIKKSKADQARAEENSKEDDEIKNEINVLRSLDHPNILKIFEFFSSKDSYLMVTEFCQGGDLFQEIVPNPQSPF